jgi:predicted methyltransferase
LPPSRWSSEDGKTDDPKFDHAKYDAIGESDRMTLRFRKPE